MAENISGLPGPLEVMKKSGFNVPDFSFEDILRYMTPAGDVEESWKEAKEIVPAFRRGDTLKGIAHTLGVPVSLLGAFLPGTTKDIKRGLSGLRVIPGGKKVSTFEDQLERQGKRIKTKKDIREAKESGVLKEDEKVISPKNIETALQVKRIEAERWGDKEWQFKTIIDETGRQLVVEPEHHKILSRIIQVGTEHGSSKATKKNIAKRIKESDNLVARISDEFTRLSKVQSRDKSEALNDILVSLKEQYDMLLKEVAFLRHEAEILGARFKTGGIISNPYNHNQRAI